MMNALEQAWEVLEGIKPGLYGEHIRTALDRGGIVHLGPDCVYMGIPSDPVEGDDAHTFLVLFVCGSGFRAGIQADYLLGLGYTHVIWCREVKGYGKQGLQKHDLRKFARLAQRLNRNGNG